jgi:voltage-gated sodium channel
MSKVSNVFERVVVGAIIANVAVVLAGLVADDGPEEWLEVGHNLILGVFLAELTVHLRAHGWRFLRSPWGAFDTSLILLSLLPALGLDTSLLRLGRAARLAHLLRHVSGLRVLRLLRANASLVKLAGAASVALMLMMLGAAGTARADDDDPSTEICTAFNL